MSGATVSTRLPLLAASTASKPPKGRRPATRATITHYETGVRYLEYVHVPDEAELVERSGRWPTRREPK